MMRCEALHQLFAQTECPLSFRYLLTVIIHDVRSVHSRHIQHQGHSRTIVGYEVNRAGETNLLIFDPSKLVLHSSQSSSPRQLSGNLRASYALQPWLLWMTHQIPPRSRLACRPPSYYNVFSIPIR